MGIWGRAVARVRVLEPGESGLYGKFKAARPVECCFSVASEAVVFSTGDCVVN